MINFMNILPTIVDIERAGQEQETRTRVEVVVPTKISSEELLKKLEQNLIRSNGLKHKLLSGHKMIEHT